MLGDEPKREHHFEPKWVECFEPLSSPKRRKERSASMIAEMGHKNDHDNNNNNNNNQNTCRSNGCTRILQKSRRLSLSHLDDLDQGSDDDETFTKQQEIKIATE